MKGKKAEPFRFNNRTKAETMKAARAFRQMMTFGKWDIQVWENLGWHFAIRCGAVTVHPSAFGGKCRALISDHADGSGGGLAVWSTHAPHVDPNEAVRLAVQEALNYVTGLADHVGDVIGDLGLIEKGGKI
jgi:hypothetical protein